MIDHEIIPKESIPEPERIATIVEQLYDLLKDLPPDKALHLKCTSFSEAKDKQSRVHQTGTRLRKSEPELSIRTSIYEEKLSPLREAAYERSKNRGDFKRSCHLYVWKELKTC